MIYLNLKYQFQQVKRGGFPSFEMVDYEIFRFVYYFFIELSCVYFDTYKRSPKEFFLLVPYMSALTRMNVLKKPKLSYVLEKKDSCVFALLLRKHSFIGSFLKILQLVHARNRPIQQLFVPFPVE
jgi:hypothetical protein